MNSYKWIFVIFMVIALVLSFCLGVTNSFSEDKPIKLTYSSPYTLNITYAQAANNWLKYIEKQSNGKVSIKPYWGGTLISGREVLAELEKGVADMALGSLFTKKGFEITWAVGTFILNSPSPEITARVSREIFDKFQEYQDEFPRLLVLGFRNVFDNVLQTKKEIKTLDDLKGLIINSGSPGDVIFPVFGARTVKVPPPEWYTSLQKGTFDGCILQNETLKGWRLGEVIDYVSLDIKVPGAGLPMTYMNLSKFKSLPEDIQTIILDSKDFLYNEQISVWGGAQQDGVDFAKEQGVKFIHLPEQDISKWQGALTKVAQDEAAKLDAIGKPGTTILNEALRLIKEYNKH